LSARRPRALALIAIVGGARDHHGMNPQQATIDEILRRFFDRQLDQQRGMKRTRIVLVEQRLRECLEAEAERILVTADLQILAAERQFQPAGAVARTMHADDLVFILSLFVRDPWLPDDPVQRGTQLRLADALTGHLLLYRLVDFDGLSCPLLEIRGGIDLEKAALTRLRRERRRATSSA
jgi:hypothetical protein